MEDLVTAFSVDMDKTRIGLVQYSSNPRTEWQLNTHSTKQEVVSAIRKLPYRDGGTNTGLALTFALENSFKPESGSRVGVPKIGILITDGASGDSVDRPAQNLKDAGIELFAIGVQNADETELKRVASPPVDTHVYSVDSFSVMSNIVRGLTQTVCDRVEELDKENEKCPKTKLFLLLLLILVLLMIYCVRRTFPDRGTAGLKEKAQ